MGTVQLSVLYSSGYCTVGGIDGYCTVGRVDGYCKVGRVDGYCTVGRADFLHSIFHRKYKEEIRY
jgi:hypothetical protein